MLLSSLSIIILTVVQLSVSEVRPDFLVAKHYFRLHSRSGESHTVVNVSSAS